MISDESFRQIARLSLQLNAKLNKFRLKLKRLQRQLLKQVAESMRNKNDKR